MQHETVIVLDFGGQYNQLIARRVRENNVYCEIYSYKTDLSVIKAKNPKGIIFTGGPNSVYLEDSPTIDPEIFSWGVPVLGICYGSQLMMHLLGGHVCRAPEREYGKTEVFVNTESKLFTDVQPSTICWMSHNDYIEQAAPGFQITAHTANCPVAAVENAEKGLYAVQFHPEVLHTAEGKKMLRNFVYNVCGCSGDWKMDSFVENNVKALRERIGEGKVLCALSGGVDSSVLAAMLAKAIGKQLTCVFVDHGLLRKNEKEEVCSVFGPGNANGFDINFICVDARDRYFSKLKGITEPERKRKIIGEEFIRVFEEEAKKIGKVDFLAQGTIYPDVVESGLGGESTVIKSHHNVGGLPDTVDNKALVEPLRSLIKAGERPALVNGGSLASLSPETQSAIGALRRNGTDWGREIYRTALNQQYSVSISGGSGKTGYYFSGGYYNEQGTTVGTGFERLNLTMKTDYDLLQNLRFGASVFVGQNKNDSYLSDTDVFTNPSRYTRTVHPYLNAYNPDGSYAYDPDMTVNTGNTDVLDFNFLEERARTEYTLKTRSIKTIFDLDYRPVKGLKLYTQFGLQVDNSATEKMAQENTYFTRKYQLKSMVDQVVRLPKGGVIQNWNGDLSQYNWKAQAEYAGTFGGKHELDLMAGLEMRGVTNTTVHTKGFGYDHKTMTTKPINVPEDSDLLDDESFRQYTKSFYENRYMSYFFTGSYTYDNRYTVFGSMRYDGTNLFGVDPKYKFNPMWSISGAWSINRERFLRDARWLDNLRLRVSYGAQGNIDRTPSPYSLGTWNSTSLGGASEDRIDVTSPPNQNLRWETTYSWNTALDFAAFEHRIGFTFELYGRRSKDLITTRTIPSETGFISTSSNYGEISSKGIEFTLNTVNVRTRDFRWETSINIAHNTDKVEKVRIDDNSWSPSLQGYSSGAVFAIKTAGQDANGIPIIWRDGKRISLQEFVGFRVEASDPW